MPDPTRPACIRHWSEIENPQESHYPGDADLLGFGAPFGRHFGLQKIGIHHERLPPGRRSSYPHAESHEEEFVYVLEGTPDVWLDGTLYPLKPGDGVGFPPGTGQSHTFINNTDAEIRLLVVGQTALPENRVIYPRNPEQQARRTDWWSDAPARPDGGHDGLPDAVRRKRNGQ